MNQGPCLTKSKTERAGYRIGSTFPPLDTTKCERVDRLTPTRPGRAARRSDMSKRAPYRHRQSSFAPARGEVCLRSTLTTRHRPRERANQMKGLGRQKTRRSVMSKTEISVVAGQAASLPRPGSAGKPMSALPPKADMCSAQAYVRFVPQADTPLIRSPRWRARGAVTAASQFFQRSPQPATGSILSTQPNTKPNYTL